MWSITVNVVVQGLLTGLVYGLMALGLSVIFGVVRVVNFAHGELTVVAMYSAFLLFQTLGLDPLLAVIPVAAAFFGLGYLLQSLLINPFVGRAEHEQFILLVGLAIIIVNGLLMIFGPDARPVSLAYGFDSYVVGPLIICEYYIGSVHGVRDLLNGDPVSGATYWWLAGYIVVVALSLVLTAPFRAAVATMLYVDRRFRREGLDIRIAWARVARSIGSGKGR